MSTLHGKLTVAELRADESLFDELVDLLDATARSVTIELNKHDDDTPLEDIYHYVPDSLATVKVIDARDDDERVDEIAEYADIDRDEVIETLNRAHGSTYVHKEFDFPWPQPEDGDEEEEEEEDDDADENDDTQETAIVSTSPEVVTVLLVSASPDHKERLRVDKEFRRITERIRSSRHRDRLRFEQLQAARFADLRTALMEHEPHVLHFSGHGRSDGSLVFEEGSNGSSVVSKKSLLGLLRALSGGLRLVVLNACHSQAIAAEIPPTVDLAIGMPSSIEEGDAVEFAVALYEAIGFDKSVQVAFDAAVAGLDEDEVELPRLFPLSDPSGKRARSLLR